MIRTPRTVPVVALSLIFLSAVGFAASGSAQTVFTAVEPAGDVTSESIVLREIPSLSDPAFRKRLDAFFADVKKEPTNSDNLRERLELFYGYYDALQLSGVLLNWRIGTELNYAMMILNSGLRIEKTQLSAKLLDHRLDELRLAEQLHGRTGVFVLEEPKAPVLKAKQYATVRLTYVADTPVQEGARFRIGQSWYTDLGHLQSKRSLQPNHFTVKSSNPEVVLLTGYRAWFGNNFTGLSGGNTPHVIIKKGVLQKGDRLEFTFGDRSGGSPGWMIQSMTGEAELKIEVDFKGDGVFVPIAQPRFRVIGNDAHHIRVAAPSVVHPGDRVTVKASVEDRFFNRASNPPEILELYLDGEKIGQSRSVTGDPSTFHFGEIRLSEDRGNPAYFRATTKDRTLSGTSNPVVPEAADRPYVYWGELHGHGGYTDANGSPEWYMNYARNVAFLDFASHTEHDIFLTEVHYRDIFRVTDAFNAPDEGFVTFRAYEWTTAPPSGGHHNIFYLDDTQRVVSNSFGVNLKQMYQLQQEWNDPEKVLIIPHAHAPGDWNVMGQARLVEIYSQHGSFEWFGRRYLMKGHRIGFNAASDDHLGHPGNSPSRGKSRGGLTAVLSDALDRESLFRNLKDRHTYGTSLARIYLRTDLNGVPMGGDAVIEPSDQAKVKFTGFAAGTAPITRITAVVNGEDAVSRTFLETDPNSRLLRFRVHSSSEPLNPEKSRSPAPSKRYWGKLIIGEARSPEGTSRIGIGSTVIAEMTPLGTEEYGDFQSQTGNREATFTWAVRGDHDGMLIGLDRLDPKDTVTLVIYTSEANVADHWNTQEQPRLPGEYWAADLPRQKILLREKVLLGDLMSTAWSKDFDGASRVDLKLIPPDRPKYQSFSFDLDESTGLKPGKDNHAYVRVEQLDDETAWSSPTFVEWGE